MPLSSSSSSSSPDDDEFIWTSPPLQSTPLTQQITSYEQSTLHCPVCHQFFTNAVSLRPCNHVFCSECIRRALKEGNKIRRVHSCPVCKVETSAGKEENYLVPNWGLQTAVDKYREMRALLYQNILASQQQQQQQQQHEKKKQGDSRIQIASNVGNGNGSGGVEATASHALPSASASIYDGCNGIGSSLTTPSSSSSLRPHRNCRQNSKKYTDESNSDGENEINDLNLIRQVKSNHPLTDATISASAFASTNAFTNASTNAFTSASASTAIISTKRTMKRMASYRLHNTKKVQLKRWCKENGLSTLGTDDDMKWRLRHWVDLYNAECDAMNPRPKKILVKELEKRERDEKNAKRRRTPDKVHLDKLKESRKQLGNQSNDGNASSSTMGNNTLLTSGNASFDKALKNGFNNLIAQYKGRRDGSTNKGVKRKASDLTDDSNKSSNSTSSQPVSGVASLAQNVERNHEEDNVVFTSPTTSTHSPLPLPPPPPQRETTSIRNQSRTETTFWECPMCTYHNKVMQWTRTTRRKPKCEMCGMLKSDDDKKPEVTTTTAVC